MGGGGGGGRENPKIEANFCGFHSTKILKPSGLFGQGMVFDVMVA